MIIEPVRISNMKEELEESSKLIDGYEEEISEEDSINVTSRSLSNVVPMDKLRRIQSQTLSSLKDYLSMTFGPMGSNTKIITGADAKTINSSYSKDGLKVLKNIANSGPIEMSIIQEIIEATRYVESEVGDGTTSSVILSSLIFDNLIKIQRKYNIPPYQLIRSFQNIVSDIKDRIKVNGFECTIDDIYKISMISTNGNEEVSQNIRNIYEEFGMNVDLSVGISTSHESVIRSYDGLTITEGMSDPAFINNRETGVCEIHNAHIYHFVDPIDDMNMITLFQSIINHNFYEPLANDEEIIPTVITCPRVSRDLANLMKELVQYLYSFDKAGSQKPPILIITNVLASDEVIMDDIANLCGCKSIRKYIDPNLMKADIEKNVAPTAENVWEFAGKAELVVADQKKTKFINPAHMKVYSEDGTCQEDPIYTAMINFIETELKQNESTDSVNDKGLLRKRLAALKANTVDYLVGGITISDRDTLKDLVEDAVKNCRSAAMYGVGNAANYEGLRASYELYNAMKENADEDNSENHNLLKDISFVIFKSYFEISKILYNTVARYDYAEDAVIKTILREHPYNISNGILEDEVSEDVKSSIMLDINIIDTISKIITVMVTCNQCLVQAPSLNTY